MLLTDYPQRYPQLKVLIYKVKSEFSTFSTILLSTGGVEIINRSVETVKKIKKDEIYKENKEKN